MSLSGDANRTVSSYPSAGTDPSKRQTLDSGVSAFEFLKDKSSPQTSNHPLVSASLYRVVPGLFSEKYDSSLLINIALDCDLSGRLVALQGRVQLIWINCQCLRKGRLTGLCVKMQKSQNASVDGKRDAVQ